MPRWWSLLSGKPTEPGAMSACAEPQLRQDAAESASPHKDTRLDDGEPAILLDAQVDNPGG